jgi:hypothetical protein
MDKEALSRHLESWIQWRYGNVQGRAFVVVTAPSRLPVPLEPWATQHRDAVWQLVWLDADATLCGLAPTISPEQFAVVQHTNGGVTTEGTYSCSRDGSWRRLP